MVSQCSLQEAMEIRPFLPSTDQRFDKFLKCGGNENNGKR